MSTEGKEQQCLGEARLKIAPTEEKGQQRLAIA